ncbi:MAG: hypothetical protein FWG00_02275 [Coriobacteriia bacterium]|jgi:hypothetical protein|nr:hypothetical protein [Coriobacteriia bacterium]MDR2713938.1 hypothetical protein [Coriobacteriales bacterium]
MFPRLSEDIQNFSFKNTNEERVVSSHFFSWYKGHLVLRMAGLGGRSFSFGILFLSSKLSATAPSTITTLKHEYGHTVQFDLLGPRTYLLHIGRPSMRSGSVPYRDYYNLPWEATADFFGGITERVEPEKLEEARAYLGKVLKNRWRP